MIKLLLGSYPATLHTELADKGLMPRLLVDPPVTYPGGYTMVEMEYLDPSDGWSSLPFFQVQVDSDQVERAFYHAFRRLDKFFGWNVLHGHLRVAQTLLPFVYFCFM